MRTQAGKDFWLSALRADGPAFRAVIAEADPTAPVPSCPDWTVADLTAHLSQIYSWVARQVSRGVSSAPDRTRVDEPMPEPSVAVFDERFDALINLLDSIDPEMPAWNWAPVAKKAVFWHRRMAHETAIHRWDAEFAIGRAEPLETKLAADGVGEVLDTWLPAGRGHCPPARHGVVALYASDLQQEWHVRLRENGGVALLDTGTILDDETPDRAAAGGTASDLQLVLWGRLTFDNLELQGDGSLFDCLRVG
jgi:uncharacterized protein (TIGR03083 family)